MTKTITYNTSEIRFGQLAETGFNEMLHSERFADSKKIILIDETVYDLWIQHFLTSYDGLNEAEIIQIPSGEEQKTLEICHHVWSALSEYEIERTDLIINIGGGVITDMGGFIASTFKRGLPFINVPTTLLSQVDASVGGKTGIDLGPYKNQIGVFSDAEFVFIDTNFLTTLPEKELESGYAEMLKHGLIAFKSHWDDLRKADPKNNPYQLLSRIHTSVSIKRDIVSKDYKEGGVRKLLNFGHTIGHALEGYSLSIKKPIPHGYGVAWGMIAEAYISKEMQLIQEDAFEEIDTFIRSIYPPVDLNHTTIPALQKLIKNDKKNTHGIVRFTLLKAPGEGIFNQQVEGGLIERALKFILNP